MSTETNTTHTRIALIHPDPSYAEDVMKRFKGKYEMVIFKLVSLYFF